MDLSISHGQAQRLLKQRNLLAITATGLFGLSVLLTLTAAHRDREVVLQPVLAKPLTLSSSHVDKDYLELVTRDAALLTLNRSPSNLQYWMDSILAITDPRTHGRMKAELMKIFNEQNGSSVSQYFTIEQLSVDPDAGSKEVTAEARTFRFVWSYSGVSLKLAGFGRVTKDGAGAESGKTSNKIDGGEG
ncbi:type IV conjugative transfer system protein TraE [Novosphingobium sp. CCH12-A3]|uniref:type IV conjugative transfer system protein TraE n=1 Tax=Novosphingobium sp. CCH12-A3 TaxID=1768752 RepID=UPI00078655AF|nr:type IV conjugative transfer system protein TraE [Novosphingobium sp. CCH12-A3]